MLGIATLPPTPILPSKSKRLPPLITLETRRPYFPPSTTLRIYRFSIPKQFRINAKSGDDGKNDGQNANNGGSEDEENGKEKSNGRPRLNLRWADLVLDPDPDNIVAVGLTGLLTWASVQVLWQLFVISAAILIAALKYSIVAALLIFILITLL